MDQKCPEEEENALTKRKASLKTVHKSVKNFQCVYHEKSIGCNHDCGKQGITNHSCDFCDKSFVQKDTLMKQVTTVHQGIKNFSCDLCDKTFGHKSPWEPHHRCTSRYQELHL